MNAEEIILFLLRKPSNCKSVPRNGSFFKEFCENHCGFPKVFFQSIQEQGLLGSALFLSWYIFIIVLSYFYYFWRYLFPFCLLAAEVESFFFLHGHCKCFWPLQWLASWFGELQLDLWWICLETWKFALNYVKQEWSITIDRFSRETTWGEILKKWQPFSSACRVVQYYSLIHSGNWQRFKVLSLQY